MKRLLNSCPQMDTDIKGHSKSIVEDKELSKDCVSASVIINFNEPNRLFILNSKTKAKEIWFFHNGASLMLNKGVETFVDFTQGTLYIRMLGRQNYDKLLCSKIVLSYCPGDEELNTKENNMLHTLSYNYLNRQKDKIKIQDKIKSSDKYKIDNLVVPSRPKKPYSSLTIKNNSNYHIPEWVNKNENILIGGINIVCGLLYICQPKLDEDDWMVSPAVINLRAPLNIKSPDYHATTVGYWPSYSKITPEARAAYILWLSGDRDNPEDSISWVFLFFMGLERRVIIDTKRDGEAIFNLLHIKTELLRLRDIYGFHASFNKYSEGLCHLIDLLSIPIPEETLIGNIKDKDRHPWWLRIKLGKLAHSRAPLPANLALAWAKTHPRFVLPKAAVRCPEEFDALFNIRYREKYGFGMALPEIKQKLIFNYTPATAGMEIVYIDTALPDVSRSIKLDNSLSQLLQECVKELDKYSRFLARNPEGKGTLKSLQLLPEILLSNEEKMMLQAQVLEPKPPRKTQVESKPVATPVVLDASLIAIKEEETAKVSKLLHSILSDDLPIKQDRLGTNSQAEPLTSKKSREQLGLDESHWILLNILGTKESWTQPDFASECRKLGLLPNGALDTLNESAIIYADEPLTDGEDVIKIDQRIFEEMTK